MNTTGQNQKTTAPRHEARAAELLGRGYTEVTEAGELFVGQRVRHIGEQYPDAILHGTAVIERIFIKAGGKDVELIARRDKPRWGPEDTHGFWANYHTAPVPDQTPFRTEHHAL